MQRLLILLERSRISRRLMKIMNPTNEAIVTPIMAPLFSPLPSVVATRPFVGARTTGDVVLAGRAIFGFAVDGRRPSEVIDEERGIEMS